MLYELVSTAGSEALLFPMMRLLQFPVRLRLPLRCSSARKRGHVSTRRSRSHTLCQAAGTRTFSYFCCCSSLLRHRNVLRAIGLDRCGLEYGGCRHCRLILVFPSCFDRRRFGRFDLVRADQVVRRTLIHVAEL